MRGASFLFIELFVRFEKKSDLVFSFRGSHKPHRYRRIFEFNQQASCLDKSRALLWSEFSDDDVLGKRGLVVPVRYRLAEFIEFLLQQIMASRRTG